MEQKQELKRKMVRITQDQHGWLEGKGITLSKWVRVKLSQEIEKYQKYE